MTPDTLRRRVTPHSGQELPLVSNSEWHRGQVISPGNDGREARFADRGILGAELAQDHLNKSQGGLG